MTETTPFGWRRTEIRNLVERVIDNRGKTPPVTERGIELIEIASISEESRYPNFDKIRKYVDKETYENWFRAGHPSKGDILIPTVGTIGVCCILGEDRGTIAQNLIGLKIKSENDSLFSYYALSSHATVKQIEMVVMNAVQPSLKVPEFLSLGVLMPPLPEQQKIASILTAVDEVIESTTAQINKLKDLKTGMMQELLTKGIGRGGQPHTEFKDSPVGRIPKEWKFVRFDEVVTKVGSGITPSGGSAVYTTTGVPFIRSQNVYQDGLRWDDVCFISEAQHQKMKNSQLKPKDVLLNITGASIGRCYYLPDQFGEGNVNQHVCIIRCLDAMLQHIYLAHFINSDFGQKQIMNLQAGGNREGLNFQQIRAMELPLPSLDEQLEISKVILSMESNIGKRTAKLDSLCRLKKSLMQDLLTGKVRVAH